MDEDTALKAAGLKYGSGVRFPLLPHLEAAAEWPATRFERVGILTGRGSIPPVSAFY